MVDRSLNYGRPLIERFLRNVQDAGLVLDLGAGHGDDLLIARRVHPQAELHAVEVHKPYIQELTQKGIRVHPIDMERNKLPFDDGAVDVVIMNQTLEHAKEVFWIFHETTRVLRLGASLIIGVPNLAAWHNRVLLALGKQPSQLRNYSAHIRGWTKGDMAKLIEECFGGYVLSGFGGSNFYPFPPLVARPLARLFPTLAWGICMHWRKQKQYRRGFLEYPVQQRLETNFFLGEEPG